MPVLTFPSGPLDANGYLLYHGTDAVIADPPEETEDVLGALKTHGLTLRAILLTHLHFDHMGGVAALIKATGLPVFVGREDWDMRDVFRSRGMAFGLPSPPLFEAETLAPGSVLWGGLTCEVIHAPGHSPGSLCFYFPQEKTLLSGDVLFFRSVGRADLPGGDPGTLAQSLRQRIYTLPPDTTVYPGHGQPTTVGDEARLNPYCKA